jgi:hypothetical protein
VLEAGLKSVFETGLLAGLTVLLGAGVGAVITADTGAGFLVVFLPRPRAGLAAGLGAGLGVGLRVGLTGGLDRVGRGQPSRLTLLGVRCFGTEKYDFFGNNAGMIGNEQDLKGPVRTTVADDNLLAAYLDIVKAVFSFSALVVFFFPFIFFFFPAFAFSEGNPAPFISNFTSLNLYIFLNFFVPLGGVGGKTGTGLVCGNGRAGDKGDNGRAGDKGDNGRDVDNGDNGRVGEIFVNVGDGMAAFAAGPVFFFFLLGMFVSAKLSCNPA